MAGYGQFARFYDAVMGDPEPKRRRVLGSIDRYLPVASSVLELGCGTGAILAGLGSGRALTGVDRSPEMLTLARRKCPSARLIQADMCSFALPERFDVVLCVFDTLNHVPSFDGWRMVFQRVREHLADEGLFIFDLNPLGQLRRLGDAPPWVHHFDGNTLIMDVELGADALSQWDIRIFERQDAGHFVLRHARIAELGVPLAQVKEALAPAFELLEETDGGGDVPTDESARAYFTYRRRR